jgi:hypothetical protein
MEKHRTRTDEIFDTIDLLVLRLLLLALLLIGAWTVINGHLGS